MGRVGQSLREQKRNYIFINKKRRNFFDVDVNFNSENKNVLIVDDLELSLYQLNQLMKKVGLRSFVARNKEEANAELMRHTFHYLLIDLFLPDCEDGFSLIKKAIELKSSGKQNYKIIINMNINNTKVIEIRIFSNMILKNDRGRRK